MKKFIAFLIVMFCIVQYGNAVPIDSTDTAFVNKKVDAITNEIKAVKNSVDAAKKELIDSLKSDTTKKACNCVPVIKEVEALDIGKWLLIFSPFFLLVLVVLIVRIRLKDFKFSDALTENEPPKKIIKNPEYNASIIAANASIPNLSILFPTTIEISNIEPTLSDLKEILAAKDAAVSAIQTSLDNAKNITTLNQKVADAQAELDKANTAKPQLEQALTAAQTQLTTAKATVPQVPATIAADEKSLDDAQKLVTENTALISLATENLEKTNKAVSENPNEIAKFEGFLLKAKTEAADARKNVEIAETVAKNNAAYSVNTYRPSISRYIAFITSLVIIILVVCMSSFFIYHYIRTGCAPDFGALSTMLIALGLGVTPYITNKISTAATANKP